MDTMTTSEQSNTPPNHDPEKHEAHFAAIDIYNRVNRKHISKDGKLDVQAFDVIRDRVYVAIRYSRYALRDRLKNARDDAAEKRDRAARHDDHEEKRWRVGEVEAYAKVLSWLSDAE